MCYFMTFKIGEHNAIVFDKNGSHEEKRVGMGLVGLWTAFAISMFH